MEMASLNMRLAPSFRIFHRLREGSRASGAIATSWHA